jgi:cytochrome oxidase Cu insertion factor (SCO1/SenC/PrrC family)
MLRSMVGMLASGAVAAVCWLAARSGGDVPTTPQAHRAADVPLSTADGRRVRLAEGPRLVVFGCVGCAERCPLTLRALSAAVTSERALRAVPRVTFVDVDPWNDSRSLVTRYIAHFPGVEGLTGDAAALVANEAALGMQPVTRPADVAAHDTRIFILDRDGVLVGVVTQDPTVDDLRVRLRAALAPWPTRPSR